ncbi:hypothetical protein [Glutamicibacter sp. NPDC087673]|uniref:hypothetical protein n=1 Tax=Glutamicibacter sp. NPDC087673 TaxID=3363997 RepID=UPI00380885D4
MTAFDAFEDVLADHEEVHVPWLAELQQAAHGAGEERVMHAKPLNPVIGHHLPVLGVGSSLNQKVVSGLVQSAQAFWPGIGADASAGKHGDAVCLAHDAPVVGR